MKKLLGWTGSKRYAFWVAVGWSVLTAHWVREFLLTRSLVRDGILSGTVGKQYLWADGVLAGIGFLLVVSFWRKWFLHGEKQNHPSDEER